MNFINEFTSKLNFDLSFINRLTSLSEKHLINNHFLLISNYFEFTLLSKVKFMIRLKMLKFNLLIEQKICNISKF
jgi:hypothetical protein